MAAIVVKGFRPTKKAEVPPPLYLTSIPGEQPSYCHACGRVVGSRKVKSGRASSTSARFCSDRCKHHKPSSAPGSLDRAIEDALYLLLDATVSVQDVIAALPPGVRAASYPARTTTTADRSSADPASASTDPVPVPDEARQQDDTRRPATKKGDHRLTCPCSLIEGVVFGRRANVSRAQGRRRRRAADDAAAANNGAHGEGGGDAYDEAGLRAALARLQAGGGAAAPRRPAATTKAEESESETDELESDEEATGSDAEDNAATTTSDDRRRAGQVRATQRERVRNACRRAVVFGLLPPGEIEERRDPTADASAEHGEEERGDGEGGRGAGKKGKKGRRLEQGPAAAPAAVVGSGIVPGSARRRLCEAVMRGEVVEPSYAKGEWGVRWREQGGRGS